MKRMMPRSHGALEPVAKPAIDAAAGASMPVAARTSTAPRFIAALLACLLALLICASCATAGQSSDAVSSAGKASEQNATADVLASMPPFEGAPYADVNESEPSFSPEEIERARLGSFEEYAPLDELGRCGAAMACVGLDTMPAQSRGDIWRVKPTGWHTSEYDFVEGEKLYNRCHLIGRKTTTSAI